MIQLFSAARSKELSPVLQSAAGQLHSTLKATNFDWLGTRYEGKVRDSYTRGADRFLVAKDTLSCFDHVLTTIPWKGQVLSSVAAYWFGKTGHIVPNHVLSYPDPNVVRARECTMVPVEVVVRGYLVGSSLRDYSAGRAVSGVTLPPGLRPHQELPEPLITPSTKAPVGHHDMPISEAEIVSSGLVDKNLWQKIHDTAIALYLFGKRDLAQRGMILADTKYEFGLVGNALHLADEVHTPDSSRIWDEATYEECFQSGTRPRMLDKEPIRLWLVEDVGYKEGQPLPVIADEDRVQIAVHYADVCQKITGVPFVPRNGDLGPVIEGNLRRAVGS